MVFSERVLLNRSYVYFLHESLLIPYSSVIDSSYETFCVLFYDNDLLCFQKRIDDLQSRLNEKTIEITDLRAARIKNGTIPSAEQNNGKHELKLQYQICVDADASKFAAMLVFHLVQTVSIVEIVSVLPLFPVC